MWIDRDVPDKCSFIDWMGKPCDEASDFDVEMVCRVCGNFTAPLCEEDAYYLIDLDAGQFFCSTYTPGKHEIVMLRGLRAIGL